MFLPHADADPRPNLVARDGGGEKFTSGEPRMILRHRDQRWKCYRPDMQHALAMHIVEFETLHGGPVHQGGMRR
jgi:hypothetical protein